MKRTLYVILAFVAVWLTGCDDMNELHQKYLDEGEDIYTGKPDSVRSYAGFNRLKLEWELNADPKITECCIYWNNRADSMIYAIDRAQGPVYSALVALPEGKYNFELLTRDAAGNHSLTEQISGVSYGAQYQETIYNRKFSSMKATAAALTINWRNIENSVGTTFSYVNKKNQKKTIFVSTETKETVIEDYVLSGEYAYQSLYLPEEDAIDTIPVATIETGKFPMYATLDKSAWTIDYASTEEAVQDGPAVAANILDDDPNSFWHSQWDGEGKNPPLPHVIIVDMQKIQHIATLEFARRKSNKDLKTVEIAISDDKTEWKNLGILEFPNSADPNSKTLSFEALESGRYLKFTVTESNNGVNASIGGIYLTGTL